LSVVAIIAVDIAEHRPDAGLHDSFNIGIGRADLHSSIGFYRRWPPSGCGAFNGRLSDIGGDGLYFGAHDTFAIGTPKRARSVYCCCSGCCSFAIVALRLRFDHRCL
jgi:hypothetical protein